MSDEFGDRMKMYEGLSQKEFLPLAPIVARIDGRSFSTFTRDLDRPFCRSLHNLMVSTTRHLVEETGALIGYTQSDEISLVFWQRDFNTQIWFGGKIQKMVSQLAAQATGAFNSKLAVYLPTKVDDRGWSFPSFDARAWSVPNQTEATNAILWREQDATKNSVSQACRAHFSHKEMEGKGRSDQMDLLMSKGINWNDYEPWCKRGTYVRRIKTYRPYSSGELEALPPKHQARQNPNLVIERTDVLQVEMPPFGRVTNREGVIFNGEDPRTESDNIPSGAVCLGDS